MFFLSVPKLSTTSLSATSILWVSIRPPTGSLQLLKGPLRDISLHVYSAHCPCKISFFLKFILGALFLSHLLQFSPINQTTYGEFHERSVVSIKREDLRTNHGRNKNSSLSCQLITTLLLNLMINAIVLSINILHKRNNRRDPISRGSDCIDVNI